jgi:hypothetical protein
MTIHTPSHLTDDALMAAAAGLAGDERDIAARLVAHLVEIDRRGLFVPAGYSSLYAYCREGLRYSEDAAFNRSAAARVARRYAVVVDMLADGRLSLTTVKLLAPILKDDNWERTFAEAAHLSGRDVEKLVARLDPKPDVPSTVRRIAAPAVAQSSTATTASAVAASESEGKTLLPPPTAVPERPDQAPAPGAAGEGDDPQSLPRPPAARRPIVAPLAPARYRVQFTIGEETEKKLRRLQTLLKREIPDGDPALIFEKALTLLLARVESRKLGLTARPRAGQAPARVAQRPTAKRPRTMPAGVRRIVGLRDEERCTFVGRDGRRCTARAYLEYHHAGMPFAHGGPETPANIALHCRAHNAYEGARIFGRPLPREVREARILYDTMMFPVPERRA